LVGACPEGKEKHFNDDFIHGNIIAIILSN